MPSLIMMNGQVTSVEEACLSPLDRGFLYGDAVFETILAFGSRVMAVQDHLNRLRASAEIMTLPVPWSDEELSFELDHVAEELGAAKASLRLVVTGGQGMGLNLSEGLHPNRLIYANRAPVLNSSVYEKGIKIDLCERPYTLRAPNAKLPQYSQSIRAIRQANLDGFDDVVWVNSEGDLAEATTSNLFLIGRDGDLVEIATPPGDSGILMGLTRAKITELLTRSQIKVTERRIYRDEVPRFDEGFVCSTVRGLVPLSQLGSHKLQSGRVSSIYRHIERLFKTHTTSILGHRIDWNTGRPLDEEDVH